MILIAEDDRTSRAILCKLLEKDGHDVLEAAGGLEAWDVICRHAPPVAILDWMMPDVDGVELCRRIRRDPRFASMYVIILTGRHTERDLVEGLEAGADDYVRKPLRVDELRARLNVAFRIATVTHDNEQLLASLPSILVGLDADGRVTRWNAQAEGTFGLTAAAATGRRLADCEIAWTDVGLLERLTWGESDTMHGELSFVDSCGRIRGVGVTVTRMTAGRRRPGRLLLASEITERRALEMQLRQSQKLQAIGQLAAGIAHEINTPMQYIGDNLRFIQDAVTGLESLLASVVALASEHPSLSPEARAAAVERLSAAAHGADLEFLRENLPDSVAQSLEGVERVSRIVRAMKEFAHPDGGEKELVDLNHAIETTLVVARNELKYLADVQLTLDPDLPRIPCLGGEINQVLLNLLVNAAHAIAEANRDGTDARGVISVATRQVAGEVEIRVSDTGTGIPEGIRTRVFEPFFTTKDVGQGTGQGLALAHSTIVGRHGGRIWFEPAEGRGTTFIIRLPLGAVPAAA